MAIITDVLQYGSNSHPTTSETANAYATDLISDGIIGTITATNGIAPTTGAFAVNAQGTPDTTVAVTAGVAYVTATPTGQGSQRVRIKMTANQNVTIAANATGGTRFDWIYLKVDPTNANNPNAAADNVTTLFTSRSTSSVTDNGTPPTYGYCIAVITVANGFATITNSVITDKRVQTGANALASTVGGDGSLNPSILLDSSDRIASYIKPGTGVIAISSGLIGTFSNITYYISGKRYTATSIASKTYAASSDTYVDIDTTGTVLYTPVANNAASPALAANSIRAAIVVTSGAAITVINQGSVTATAPTVSSSVLTVSDSLGNPICPSTPNPTLIGYRQITSDFATASTTAVQVTGLSCPVIIPTGRRVRISVQSWAIYNSATSQVRLTIWDGTVGSGTAVGGGALGGVASIVTLGFVQTIISASGAKTYNAALHSNSASTSTFSGSAVTAAGASPGFIAVELV